MKKHTCVVYLDDRGLNGEICDSVDLSVAHGWDVSAICRKGISRNECSLVLKHVV